MADQMSARETDPLMLHEHRKVLAQQIAAELYDSAVVDSLRWENYPELGKYDADLVREKGPAYPPGYQRIEAWKAFGVGG
jgi:hypothetical protein